MNLTTENILLVGSILLFTSLILGRTGFRLGMPTLLIFLIVGMLFGSEGVGIRFEDPHYAQFIGIVSLTIILFSGGMGTKLSEVKPILGQGIILATLGVLFTTIITGLFVFWVVDTIFPQVEIPFTNCLLLAAVMSSTDSASVFNILRSRSLRLKHNLRSLLELESGSNDPMAYMLTILLIQIIRVGGTDAFHIALTFIIQFCVGIMIGYLIGRLAVVAINRIHPQNESLYQVILLTFAFFTFSFTDLLHGNGYLAVYITGLIVGNRRLTHKRNISNFFDGLTWLAQIIMFLTLGLMVRPSALIDIAGIGLLTGIFMILIARPVSMLLCLSPFRRMTWQGRIYVSWVGLRGAVPIIFATYPLIANTPKAQEIFDIVFFITILSLLIQGTTVTYAAKLLGLAMPEKKIVKEFGMELAEEIKSILSEIIVTPDMLAKGNHLIDIKLPDNTLVVLIKRLDRFFVPDGNTHLLANDKLLIISDNEAELHRIYKEFGVEEYAIYKN